MYKLAAAGDEVKVSLAKILATGMDDIPPDGFVGVHIEFQLHTAFSHPCSLELTLHTKYSDYGDFKGQVNIVFTMHRVFGLASLI